MHRDGGIASLVTRNFRILTKDMSNCAEGAANLAELSAYMEDYASNMREMVLNTVVPPLSLFEENAINYGTVVKRDYDEIMVGDVHVLIPSSR